MTIASWKYQPKFLCQHCGSLPVLGVCRRGHADAGPGHEPWCSHSHRLLSTAAPAGSQTSRHRANSPPIAPQMYRRMWPPFPEWTHIMCKIKYVNLGFKIIKNYITVPVQWYLRRDYPCMAIGHVRKTYIPEYSGYMSLRGLVRLPRHLLNVRRL